MKGAQLFVERRLPILGGLEKHKDFASGFDLFLPAIDRVNSRNEVRARGELFFDQRLGDAIGRFRVRKSANGQQNLVRHRSVKIGHSERNREVPLHNSTKPSRDPLTSFLAAEDDGSGKSNRHQAQCHHRKTPLPGLASRPFVDRAGAHGRRARSRIALM